MPFFGAGVQIGLVGYERVNANVLRTCREPCFGRLIVQPHAAVRSVKRGEDTASINRQLLHMGLVRKPSAEIVPHEFGFVPASEAVVSGDAQLIPKRRPVVYAVKVGYAAFVPVGNNFPRFAVVRRTECAAVRIGRPQIAVELGHREDASAYDDIGASFSLGGFPFRRYIAP